MDERIETFDKARRAVAQGVDPWTAAERLVAGLTPDERLWCLDGDTPTWAGLDFLLAHDGYHRATNDAARIDRVGMPGFAFADGPRGVVVGNATCFPVAMARAATWDPALEERVGDAIGRELRASGATLFGGVCVNLLRHPAWGRAQETYGEDPHLLGELGAALTRGVQRHALACVKHFACNSMEDARFEVDVTVDEQALHEVYLPHFRRVVDEGVACVMSAYNAVNGEWCGQHRGLLTEVLRGEWGFQGFVISDFVFGLRDAAASLAAGLDVEMPYRMIRATHLPAALDDGTASWDDVDRAATRVIATLLRFDGVLSAAPPDRSVIGCPEHRALAREVAARSVVLLRNEPTGSLPVLPLDPTGSIAVVGPLADTVNLGDGGSSDVWALDAVTVLDGLRAALPGTVVHYDPGDDPVRAAQVAAGVDAAVVVVGYTFADEGECVSAAASAHLAGLYPGPDDPELVARFRDRLDDLPPTVRPDHVAGRPPGLSPGGDRRSLRLPAPHVALIRAVAAANPRTVVVLQGGSAVLGSEWEHQVPAVVQAWYGGVEAGHGLADVLVGAVNPSGRLPFSVPTDEGHLPPFDPDADRVTYDRWLGWWQLQREAHTPAHPFGSGLSYTTFELGPFAARREPGAVHLTGTVANTGHRDGADVVQVYATLPHPDAPRRLVAFARVVVAAGDRAAVDLRVPVDRLATRDVATHGWTAASGRHTFTVARFAGDPAGQPFAVDL